MLLLTALMVLVLIVLWMVRAGEESDVAQAIEYEEAQQKPTNFADMGELDDVGVFLRQVEKVQFENIVHEVRSENPEFKDAEFINQHRKSWTIEVMDVAKEGVILDYLSTHEKKAQFVYFRYVDDDSNKRYKLVFDDFNDKAGAEAAIQVNDFHLPASFVQNPVLFEDYLKVVDDYQLQSNFRDYGRATAREVLLAKRAAPVVSGLSSSYTESTLSRRAQNYTPRRAGENLQPSDNAFAPQPKNTGRYVQPDSESIKGSNNPNDVLIIEEVPSDVIDQNSQGNKPAVAQPPKPAKPAADSISELIDTIE